jgi:hypothetical protein
MAVTRRMRSAAFLCNRHPRLCSVGHNHPFCINHPRLCAWWIKLVRTHHTHRCRQWRPGVGIRGLWCVQKTQMLGGPFRLDLRIRDQCKLGNQLSQCRLTDPSVLANSIPFPVDGIFAHSLAVRAAFWSSAWSQAEARLLPRLPHERRMITEEQIWLIISTLDELFWGTTLRRKLTHLGWQIPIQIQNHSFKLPDMRRSEYPIANVAIHHGRRELALTVQIHPSYYPKYPHICDGIDVASWKHHLLHILAHETIHMVRAVFCKRTNQMYPEDFQTLNGWVYGHTSKIDADHHNAPEDIDIG